MKCYAKVRFYTETGVVLGEEVVESTDKYNVCGDEIHYFSIDRSVMISSEALQRYTELKE